jgi:hypothetical protein
MEYVYVVKVAYNYEGSQIDSIWSSQERATKRKSVLEAQKCDNYVYISVIAVDDLTLLQEDTHMMNDWQYERLT